MIAVQPETTGRLGNHLFHAAYAWDTARRLGGVVSYERQEPNAFVCAAQRPGGPVEEVAIGSGDVVQMRGLWIRESPGAEAVRGVLPLPVQLDRIAVHVRRGDFVSSKHFELLSADYYRRAMLEMRKFSRLPFLFFSDDPPWCRQEFPGLTVVGAGDPADDLMVMAGCRHHITANSTFSWWAQFIGRRPGQIVISPRAWLRGEPGQGEFTCQFH